MRTVPLFVVCFIRILENLLAQSKVFNFFFPRIENVILFIFRESNEK